KGIITVVDSVSAMGGQELKVDEWKIDMVLGGSQKCMSAPPGLSFLSVSEDAFKAMEERKTPIASYYCNLLVWKDYYKNKWFPYTPPISDIVGLRAAVDNILEDKDIVLRHNNIAKACREAIVESGLKLYLKQGYSNTVTVLELPKEVEDKALRTYMQDKYNVIVAGSFGYLQGKVIRIGHMGENANIDKMAYTLFALENSLEYLGYKLKESLTEAFLRKIME
ncbi:alanine--glyoxylate aminotransferase family protein, partial [Clostridium botulinum]